MVELRACTVSDVASAPGFADALEEYALECHLPEIGQARAQLDTYLAIEKSGVFHLIGAFDGPTVVGFAAVLAVSLPHYGVLAAIAESLFVVKAYRLDGVGWRLLNEVRQLARRLEAKTLLLTAPVGGALDRLLHLTPGARHSNNVYVELLA